MCLGNGWKDLGEQWTQIKSTQKPGTFGEHFTSWRNSLVMYQMRKKLQLRWDVITLEGFDQLKWASSVCPDSFETKRMNCLGRVPSRQLNVPSHLILSFNFRLLLFLLLWFLLLYSSSLISYFPPWNEMCYLLESIHILLRSTKSIWPFVFKEWITLSICPLDEGIQPAYLLNRIGRVILWRPCMSFKLRKQLDKLLPMSFKRSWMQIEWVILLNWHKTLLSHCQEATNWLFTKRGGWIREY